MGDEVLLVLISVKRLLAYISFYIADMA